MHLLILWDPLNPLVHVTPVLEALSGITPLTSCTFEKVSHRVNPNRAWELRSLGVQSIDALLWVEGGPLPKDLEQFPGRKLAWLLNTNLEPTLIEDLRSQFDLLLVAQRSLAHLPKCQWLPAAANPVREPLKPGYYFLGADPTPPQQAREALWFARYTTSAPKPGFPMVYCPGQAGHPHHKLLDVISSGALALVDQASDIRDLGDDGQHFVILSQDERVRIDQLSRLAQDGATAERITQSAREIVAHLHTPAIRATQLLESFQSTGRVLSGHHFQPTVSVLTCCYRFLKRFQLYMESLARQTFPLGHLEIVVADPQSPDGLADWLPKFAEENPNLRLIHLPLDKRYYRNRGYCINRAFDHSSGQVIISTDGDLLFPTNLIPELSSACLDQPQHVFGVRRIFLERTVTERLLRREMDPYASFEELACSQGDGEPDGKVGVLGYCQVTAREAFSLARYPETWDRINQSDIVFVERLAKYAGVTPQFLPEKCVLHLWHPRDWGGTKELL